MLLKYCFVYFYLPEKLTMFISHPGHGFATTESKLPLLTLSNTENLEGKNLANSPQRKVRMTLNHGHGRQEPS